LEQIIESMHDPEINNEFRLFLTTAACPDFPVNILQEGIKITVETSGDVKQMLLSA